MLNLNLEMNSESTGRERRPQPGYDLPARLCDLPIGTRFLSYSSAPSWGLPDEWQTGTLLWASQCGCEIWWDGDKAPTRCAAELDVYILDDPTLSPDEAEQAFWTYTQYTHSETGEGYTMNTEQVAGLTGAAKALIAQINFQYKGLVSALEGDNKAQAQTIMSRLDKKFYEAKQTHTPVPDPPTELAEYTPLVEAIERYKGQVKEESEAAQVKKESAQEKQNARAVAIEKHATEQATQKAERPKRTKPAGDAKLHPCLDGCGAMVKGNFAMGHDAKLKSLLLKLEKGEATPELIPEPCLDLVKLKAGEPIVERDHEGKPKGEPKKTWQIIEAPVRFPGRDDVKLTHRED